MKIESSTLEELFIAGTRGMNNILSDGFCDKYDRFEQIGRIEIQSSDYTCLLIDFLSEVLSLSYTENSIYCEVRISQLTKYKVIADISGNRIDYFEEEINSVTYHEANVQKNDSNQWETCIIFDI